MNESATSISLLYRLRQADRDEKGWREFVERYGPRIYDWCLSRGLQSADAEDVTQNVLVKLAEGLRRFDYDPSRSFRGWLRTITENAVRDFLRGLRGGRTGEGGSEIWRRLSQVEAASSLGERLNETFDLELLEEAMARVSSRVTSRRWRAWFLTAREGRSGAVAAAELEMKVASVYTARNQVQKLIREEIQRLEAGTS